MPGEAWSCNLSITKQMFYHCTTVLSVCLQGEEPDKPLWTSDCSVWICAELRSSIVYFSLTAKVQEILADGSKWHVLANIFNRLLRTTLAGYKSQTLSGNEKRKFVFYMKFIWLQYMRKWKFTVSLKSAIFDWDGWLGHEIKSCSIQEWLHAFISQLSYCEMCINYYF